MKKVFLVPAILGLINCGSIINHQAIAEPVAWDKNDQVWLTQESAHFSVHFRQGHEHQAARVLDIAEQVNSELEPFFKSQPVERTQVVLVDDYDFSNGWASPLPFAQIRLIMSPPEDANSLENNDEWLHLLIKHEYTHILHMEMGAGSVQFMRKIFGRNPFLFPHALTPSFLLEGLAVYMETNKELGYGRLQGSEFAMQMRTEVQSGQLKSLSETAVASRKFPYGYNYLYGAYFVEYLVNTYGEDKLQAFLYSYSRKLLPYFLLQRTAQQTFGKDFDHLWSDFQTYLNDRFNGDVSQMITVGTPIKTLPYKQVTTSTKQGFLINQNNGEDKPELSIIGTQNPNILSLHYMQKAVQGSNIIAMDATPSGAIVVAKLNTYADGRVLADLYLYHQEKWQRLTHQQRFRKVRWSDDGRFVIASRNQNGRSELWQIDTWQQKPMKLIWQGGENTVLGGFDVQSNLVIASVKAPLQGWNLQLLDLSSLTWTRLTNSKAVENAPEFIDTNKVLYSADYNGVYNIYTLDITTHEIDQLTKEAGGAFEPKWQKDFGLLYQSYDSKGYTLRTVVQPKVLQQFTIDDFQGEYNYPDPVFSSAKKSTLTPYSPWQTLTPTTWLPILSADDYQSTYGLQFMGEDALGRHQYGVNFTWDTKNHLAAYDLNYHYDNRWIVSLSRNYDYDEAKRNYNEYQIEQHDSALVQRDHITDWFDDDLSLNAGIYWDKSKDISPQYQDESDDGNEALMGLAFKFDNREAYINVPGVGWGTYADFIIENNDVLNSDYSGTKYQAQLATTWDLPGRSTITVRLAGGYSDHKAKAFKLGGHDFDDEQLLFGRNKQVLRGYGGNVQQGHRYITEQISWAMPITRIERNWSLYPIGLGDISSNLFIDSGKAWSNETSKNKQLSSLGAEMKVEFKVGYATLPVTFGYAHGFDSKLGKDSIYATLVSTF